MPLLSPKAPIPHRRLACLGIDWQAERSLRATLALLGGKTRETWDFGDGLAAADVVIYEPGNQLAQALERRESPAAPRKLFLPCDGEAAEAERRLRHPFGASRLIRCLDHASEVLPAPRGEPARDSLCQRLDEALRSPGVRGVALLTGERRGLLLPAEAALRWPLPLGGDEIARLLAPDVEIQVLRADDYGVLRKLQAITPQQQPWETALWAVGVATSGGRLLRRLGEARAYGLRRRPDFGTVGSRKSDLRCSALLLQAPMTPGQLASAAGIPPEVANNFLNAAALCGLLDGVPAEIATAMPRAGELF
jgi:hypothetical protein